jgi:hypothetical protein
VGTPKQLASVAQPVVPVRGPLAADGGAATAVCRDIGRLDTSLFDAAKLRPSGPKPGEGLAVWDNDGIVNTASMLWPDLEHTRLVAADPLDIVGHYLARETVPCPDASGRHHTAYDGLGSHSAFTQDEFDHVWKDIFDFCVS